ncbi:hypothetical protein JCGZ_23072 [Jatropha curcas]|uniref:C2 domain-containing protein n=2 Tax=Jatropha curcas TaxID=180498 RepID=A0A067JUQ4_JATCU|nr:hypothetical protein JCGZ_23072 [Jatropha curcas]
MDWISLELKLISCRDLKAFNLFQKLSVYAVVSISNDSDEEKKKKQNREQQRQKTLIDGGGGSNPEWNQVMQFDLKHVSQIESDHLFLKFKLRCAGVLYGKRSIGKVCVPFKDLIEEFDGNVRFVSYQVRTSDGKPNGVLNFSYKVKKEGDDLPRTAAATTTSHFSRERLQVEPQKKRLYPSLDDIRSPLPVPYYIMSPTQLPAFVHHPCPSPLVQSAGPYWHGKQTAAGNEYGLRGGQLGCDY